MAKRDKSRRDNRNVPRPPARIAPTPPPVAVEPAATAAESSAVKPGQRPCARCNSLDIRRSRMRSLFEHAVVNVLPVMPYRCRYCGVRFWRMERTATSVVRAAFLLSILAIALVVTAGFAGW